MSTSDMIRARREAIACTLHIQETSGRSRSLEMRVPEEFRHLAQCFYQGSDEEVSGLEEWAALALRHLDADQRKVVKQFLDERLSVNQSGAELQSIWAETDADFYFADESLRELLTLVRNMA